MKNCARWLCVLAVFSASPRSSALHMIEQEISAITEAKSEKAPRDLFEVESGYVFQSELHGGVSFGRQYELQNSFAYGHRFLLSGNLYLHLGIAYDRFDFGTTRGPVPTHLQSAAAVIGIDYMHDKDVGAFLQVKPGFYTQDDFGKSAFDAPITGGRIFVLQPEKLYLFVGANVTFLRGSLPVVPIAGLIWLPNDKLRVMGILPEPRVIYSPCDKLEFWAGGEITGGSFRTDRNDTIVPHKLSNAQVDYSDYRAGAGFIYSPSDDVSIDFGGGYSIERSFDFYRAGEKYKTDPAPYLRFELKARF